MCVWKKGACFLFMQIVIATPGRLIEILKQKAIQLDSVKVVVVDEVRFCYLVQVAALFKLLYFQLKKKKSSFHCVRLTLC